MSIHRMTAAQYQSFLKAQNGKTVETFARPRSVSVIQTDDGTVTVVEQNDDGVLVIGDSVSVYWGPEAPDYLR